jgi:hypothetical protein
VVPQEEVQKKPSWGLLSKHDNEALIGTINGGEIPASHRLVQQEPITVQPDAWNSAIFEAGLKTQNYDKGFDRFVRKFKPEEPMGAVMAIEKGVHSEFGTAILFTQENRRCLLLDTLHGITEEDALWYTMLSWAKFQRRISRPKEDPGQLHFPAVYSHVFEKYCDTLEQPLAHPGSDSETLFTKACMQEYAAALQKQDLPPALWGAVRLRRVAKSLPSKRPSHDFA